MLANPIFSSFLHFCMFIGLGNAILLNFIILHKFEISSNFFKWHRRKNYYKKLLIIFPVTFVAFTTLIYYMIFPSFRNQPFLHLLQRILMIGFPLGYFVAISKAIHATIFKFKKNVI